MICQVPKKEFILLLFLLVFSCTINNECKTCNQNYIKIIKGLSKDVYSSNLNIKDLIKKYFYKPNEILSDLSEIELHLYEGYFGFFKKYVLHGTGQLHVLCGKELLNAPYFKWLYRPKYEKEVICLYFYNSKYKSIYTISFYFFSDKIVSFMPISSANSNAVTWLRTARLRSLKETITSGVGKQYRMMQQEILH